MKSAQQEKGLTLSQSAKLNGFKSAKKLAEAMQLTYDGLYKLYHDRPEEYQLRLDAAIRRHKESKSD